MPRPLFLRAKGDALRKALPLLLFAWLGSPMRLPDAASDFVSFACRSQTTPGLAGRVSKGRGTNALRESCNKERKLL